MRISDWSSDVCSSDLPAGTIAKIITVATQKGGAGKTTTSMNVAADFARRGYRALVVSADKQGSAVAWAAAASEIGRASCRERVRPYVSISVVAVSLKKKKRSETYEYNNSAKQS